MESPKQMPVLMRCRLCLSYTGDCAVIQTEDGINSDIRYKIKKYLNLEIKDGDPFSKSVCQQCIDRINEFHVFSNEVAHVQSLLQASQSTDSGSADKREPHIFTIASEIIEKNSASSMNFVMTPAFLSKRDGNFVITLQATPTSATGETANRTNDVNMISASSQSLEFQHLVPVNVIEETIAIDENEKTEVIEVNESILDNNMHPSQTLVIEEVSNGHSSDESLSNECGNSAEINSIEAYTPTRRTQRHKRAKVPKRQTKSSSTKTIELEQELDSYQNDAEFVVNDDDSSDGSEYNDSNTITVIKETEEERNKFKKFPTDLIRDSKLTYKGKELIRLMTNFYRLECDLCLEANEKTDVESRLQFDQIADLYQHFESEHNMKGYVICCGIKLIRPRAMALHMARHLQPDAFKCPQCDKMLTCPKILRYHIQNHLPEKDRPLACSQCPRRFSYSSALVAHAISHLPEDQRVAHICDECGKCFASAGRLRTHVNVSHTLHHHDYVCHICARRFACRGNLTYHLSTHQPKVRQVQCEKCGKWLKNKFCLRKHMEQHSTVRYSCTLCSYSAQNNQCLRNHLRVQHSDEKPHCCDECGKKFKLRSTLRSHMVQHTGVKKFSCQFCSRTFASSGNFYAHRKRMHPKELAAVKLQQEEEEKLLRERLKSSEKLTK